MAALGSEHVQKAFLANVDTAAAETFIQCDNKASDHELKQKMLAATFKYQEELKSASPEEMAREPSDATLRWIVFKPPPSPPKNASPAVAETKILPQIIRFDQESGKPLNEQESRITAVAERIVDLPWRQWLSSDSRVTIGEQDMAMRAGLQA